MVHELVDAGEPVVVLDNLSTGFASSSPARFLSVAGSTGDHELVKKTIARPWRSPPSSISPHRSWCRIRSAIRSAITRNNTMNTCALLDAAIESGVRQVIFSSTAAVYGNAEITPVPGRAPRRRFRLMASSKLMSESMLPMRQGATACASSSALFPTSPAAIRSCAPRQSTAARPLIKVAARRRLGSGRRWTSTGPTFRRLTVPAFSDYIHVSDLARAHIGGAGASARGGETRLYFGVAVDGGRWMRR